MLTYTSSVTIDRPPGEVFSYLAEPEKQAQWSDVPMRRLTGGPFGVGTRMELSFGRRPLRATVVLEVTALERDQRFGFTTVSGGPIQWDGEYRLEAIGTAGTRVSQEGRLRFRGLWRLAEPIVGAEIRHNEIKELEKLKAVVEAGRP